jgi:hypothetical protein
MLMEQSYLVVYSKIREEGNIKCSEIDFYAEDMICLWRTSLFRTLASVFVRGVQKHHQWKPFSPESSHPLSQKFLLRCLDHIFNAKAENVSRN